LWPKDFFCGKSANMLFLFFALSTHQSFNPWMHARSACVGPRAVAAPGCGSPGLWQQDRPAAVAAAVAAVALPACPPARPPACSAPPTAPCALQDHLEKRVAAVGGQAAALFSGWGELAARRRPRPGRGVLGAESRGADTAA
jgi:hypothetical protein